MRVAYTLTLKWIYLKVLIARHSWLHKGHSVIIFKKKSSVKKYGLPRQVS